MRPSVLRSFSPVSYPQGRRLSLLSCRTMSILGDRRARHNPEGWSMERAQGSSVVRVPAALSEADIDDLHSLAAESPSSHNFPNHDTCFLSSEGAFAERLPHIRQKLMDIAAQVDADQRWHLLRDQHVNPRVVELHTASTHRAPAPLLDVDHYDMGSLITIDVMLSGKDAFEGGAFETLEESGEMKPHAFERGEALVFVSHKYHRVAPLTSGTRQVLVMELWSGVERTCAHRCSSREGRCRFHDETYLVVPMLGAIGISTYVALGALLG